MALHSPSHFENIEIGDELPGITKTPTHDAVRTVIGLAGRSIPRFFLEEDVAHEYGLQEPVVPSDVSMAYLATAITDWAPTASVYSLDAVFRGPIFHNRPLNIIGVVTDKTEDGTNAITCELHVLNDQGDRVVNCTAIITLPRQNRQE